MKLEKLLSFLKCPYCPLGKLAKKGRKKIICNECQVEYDLVKDVPILIKKNLLNSQEKDQIDWFNRHYSRFSGKYHLENWRLSMLKRVFGSVPAGKVKTYLDIGCGATGYTVIEAAKRYGWKSFGVDISLEAVLRAKALAEKEGVSQETAFLVCSAENLPFKDNLFDYVSALGVLEHLRNDQQVIKAVAKITKMGGRFYICTPNTYKRIWPFLWPIYFYLDKKIGHQRHYSLEGLNGEMKKAGFKLKTFFYNGHLLKLGQLVLDKLGLLNEKIWWRIEEKDINKNPMGIQLNAIYQKRK